MKADDDVHAFLAPDPSPREAPTVDRHLCCLLTHMAPPSKKFEVLSL